MELDAHLLLFCALMERAEPVGATKGFTLNRRGEMNRFFCFVLFFIRGSGCIRKPPSSASLLPGIVECDPEPATVTDANDTSHEIVEIKEKKSRKRDRGGTGGTGGAGGGWEEGKETCLRISNISEIDPATE